MRDAHDVGRQTILRKYAEASTDRLLQMPINEDVFITHAKNNGDTEVATHVFDAVRSRVFNFHRITSVLITKLKTKKTVKNRYL